MKKLVALLLAASVVTGNLSANNCGRDKCPCDDYSQEYTQEYSYVCPQPVFDPSEDPSASSRGTTTGYLLLSVGIGAAVVGAIAAIYCSTSSDSGHGHFHSH